MLRVSRADPFSAQIHLRTTFPMSHVHLRQFNWTANHKHYWRNIADRAHGGGREASLWSQADQMEGEGVLMITGHTAPLLEGRPMTPIEAADTYLEWAPQLAHKDWAAGFTVAMELSRLQTRLEWSCSMVE